MSDILLLGFILVSLFSAYLYWKALHSPFQLSRSITSVEEGYKVVMEHEKDFSSPVLDRLVCTTGEIIMDNARPFLSKIEYYFVSNPEDPSSLQVFTLDNLQRRIRLTSFESMLNKISFKKFDPFSYLPLNLKEVRLDLIPAFHRGGEQGGESFLDDVDLDDVVVEMKLYEDGTGPVWQISYQCWGESGPEGFLQLVLDAEDGQLVE